MFDNDSESAKNEYDDYKINLSDIFRPQKNSDSFSTLNRLPASQNYNRFASINQNYNSSITNSNKQGYLYSDRFQVQPIGSAISFNKKTQILRKKAYNLQQQRTTVKKTLINDPFWLVLYLRFLGY